MPRGAADRVSQVPHNDAHAGPTHLPEALSAPNYQVTVSDVKSAQSLRTIDLDQRTLAVPRSWRRRQLEQNMEIGVRTDE